MTKTNVKKLLQALKEKESWAEDGIKFGGTDNPESQWMQGYLEGIQDAMDMLAVCAGLTSVEPEK